MRSIVGIVVISVLLNMFLTTRHHADSLHHEIELQRAQINKQSALIKNLQYWKAHSTSYEWDAKYCMPYG